MICQKAIVETTTKILPSRTKSRTMMTNLVCHCGKRLEVSVRKDGWMLSLQAVALGNRWHLDHWLDLVWAKEIAALCPGCWEKA